MPPAEFVGEIALDFFVTETVFAVATTTSPGFSTAVRGRRESAHRCARVPSNSATSSRSGIAADEKFRSQIGDAVPGRHHDERMRRIVLDLEIGFAFVEPRSALR